MDDGPWMDRISDLTSHLSRIQTVINQLTEKLRVHRALVFSCFYFTAGAGAGAGDNVAT